MISKRHLIVLVLSATALSAGLAYLFLNVSFIPNPSSLERESIDTLTKTLFSIAGVIFAVIIVVILEAVIFHRRRRGDVTDGPPIRGFAPLEITWTVIPLVIVIVLGTYGGIVLNKMTAPPPPQTELRVDVLAFRYGWQFTYPDYGGVQSFELGLPVNRPVVLYMRSKDVIHAFWVPELGPKQDIVPGMVTELRLNPTEVGQYQVFCSQLCGAGHTYMLASTNVMSASDFEKWVQSQSKPK